MTLPESSAPTPGVSAVPERFRSTSAPITKAAQARAIGKALTAADLGLKLTHGQYHTLIRARGAKRCRKCGKRLRPSWWSRLRARMG